MANNSNLQVTFSKRRNGVFKKASELCTICDAQATIIVFSPGGKIYSFGHLHVNYVIDKLLARNHPPNDGLLKFIDARSTSSILNLNARLSHLQNMYEVERQQGEALQRIRKAKQRLNSWDAPIEELNLKQLEQLMAALKILNGGTNKKIHNQMFKHASEDVSNDPTTFGSSRIAPYEHSPVDAGSTMSVPYDAMPHVQYNRMNARTNLNVPVNLTPIIPFNDMNVGSSTSVPHDPKLTVPYNSMISGTGRNLLYDHRISRSTRSIYYDQKATGFRVIPIDPIGVGSIFTSLVISHIFSWEAKAAQLA
ncbi:hypothetical protein RJ639_036865 [Escallonia herrerae]|uniref:MADS-box domain-containing protein n=1 Tax=Escallonia herrerae TaxID=1293975 RepID=A0AA88WTF5_9ASTE|nr:hypothetical protein RJ639_036865 [Escallonia herrerae]